MHQQPYVMHDPSAMPMAMTGPGINWPGPMHPQQAIHQQPPRGFTPIDGPMQQMPMGVVGPNVEYNQTQPPLMPPQYQQVHAPNQADRQYRPWHAMPVEDGFANNPARLMQRQSGVQVNRMPPPWVQPYPPPAAVPSQAPWLHRPAAQVYPWNQHIQPVPHEQHQPQPVVPNQQHVTPPSVGVPPLPPGVAPAGHRHSHPGALPSYHHHTLPPTNPATLPTPKPQKFDGASLAARALHELNPDVPLSNASHFVHMYQTSFVNDKAALKMFSGWCEMLEESILTPQHFFENICLVLNRNAAWDLRDMLDLHNPAFRQRAEFPSFLGLVKDGGADQAGNDQGANDQSVNDRVADDQAANTQVANTQAANTQAANVQDKGTQTVNTQATDDQGANAPISSQPGNDRAVVHQAEAEGSDAIEATRNRTEALEQTEGQGTEQVKLVVKLPVGSAGLTASPRGKKRTSKHNDDEHEDVEGTGTPDSNAVDEPRTKKNKTEGPVSILKASDLAGPESPDLTMQGDIDFTDTLHLSLSTASQDSDSPTTRRSKQSRQKGTKKKIAVAPGGKRVKMADMPADQVSHVGPVFPSRRAILARESRPYIHSVCGHAFKHVEDVKSHHFGNASKVVGCLVIRAAVAQDGRRAIAEFPAWDTHESCKIGYSDIQYTQVKDGFVILDQESWDKVQAAIDAGEGYKSKLEEEFEDDDAMQDQDDVVADDNADLISEDVNEEEQEDENKNIDPFLLSSESELGWTFPATHAYGPQPVGNNALVSNTPEQMRKEPRQADSSIPGTTMLQRGAMAIPIMGQPNNYQMPDIAQPNPVQPPTTTPTKPNVPKRKVVKAGWDEKDEHDEEKLRAAALELKNRGKK